MRGFGSIVQIFETLDQWQRYDLGFENMKIWMKILRKGKRSMENDCIINFCDENTL